MRRLALLIPIVAWAAGCGDQPPPAATKTTPVFVQPDTVEMSCGGGWTYPDRRYFEKGWREEAITAGPLTLLWLDTYADDDFSRPRALYTKALLKPRATAKLAVAPADRDRIRLTTHPPNDTYAAAGGKAAIRFEGCPARPAPEPGTGYSLAVMVDSPGCATFEVTPKGGETIRRRVRFGVSDCG